MVRYYFNNLNNINWNKIYDYNCKSYELLYNNRTKENNMDLATNISNLGPLINDFLIYLLA
jgi:hypothetical protein